ncbi:MAG: hypothetical protein IPL77_07370 [Flavobacteriales bacterium]|nr:hypothetical protein [Flavobacteriales bacterium]
MLNEPRQPWLREVPCGGKHPGLPHLTEITNNVGIYFDLNPPAKTNTVLNTIVDCAQPNSIHASMTKARLVAYTFFMDFMVVAYQWFVDGTEHQRCEHGRSRRYGDRRIHRSTRRCLWM